MFFKVGIMAENIFSYFCHVDKIAGNCCCSSISFNRILGNASESRKREGGEKINQSFIKSCWNRYR